MAGYLNLSSGVVDRQFDRHVNEVFAAIEAADGPTPLWQTLQTFLNQELTELAGSAPAFASVEQAQSASRLVFEHLFSA